VTLAFAPQEPALHAQIGMAWTTAKEIVSQEVIMHDMQATHREQDGLGVPVPHTTATDVKCPVLSTGPSDGALP